jgi:hypothetical protein
MFSSRPAHRVRAYRPRFEILEARHLLSTYVVDNLGDSGAGSGLAGDLRYCITQAAEGDAITFSVTGTINLAGALPDLTHSISIEGPGPDQLTVRRDTGGDYRIFTVAAGTTVNIIGLTIANGFLPGPNAGGGAILNSGTLTISASTFSGNAVGYTSDGAIANIGTLTITNSILSGNSAGFGGNAIGNSGTMTVTNSTISDNSGGFYGGYGGGGIFNQGTLTVTASTLTGNVISGIHTIGGGGICNSFIGTLTVTDSTISGNSEANYGGGIYNENRLTVANSILSDNSATYGGGIYNSGGTATVTNSTISGNSTAGFQDGGGILNGGTLTVTNSTISGNSAANYGGGIDNYLGTVTVTDSTISSNSANDGGGIWTSAGLTVTASTLSGNSARDLGGGVDLISSSRATLQNVLVAGNSAPSSPDVAGSLTSQGHNLIGDGTGGSGFDPTDLVGTSANPIDPLLGPLADNGGPTPTMAPLIGSPAITAGDPTGAPGFDQRGAPRIVNGTIDIGAYEVQPAPVPGCSVAEPLLWPPNQQLINVGFTYQLNDDADPSTTVRVQVFGNDHAGPADAADIAFGTLRLRAERQGGGQGRVYLIVVLATDASGQTGLDVCTVLVPHDHSARSVAAAQAAAADAEEFFREFQTAPDGYALLGEGPAAEGAATAPSRAVGAGAGQQPGALPEGDHPLMVGANQVDTPAGQTITPAVLVAVVDAFGNVETGDSSGTMTLSLGANPGGGTLSGTLTLTVGNGVATFGDLSIDQAGVGYTLHATVGGGLPDIDSNLFNITM